MTLDTNDLDELRRAKELLENDSLAIKLQSALGHPIEEGMSWLPDKWTETVHQSVQAALGKALDFAVKSLDCQLGLKGGNLFHKVLVAGSGAAGGAFGLAALPLELPVSTTIMLRSIADIARSQGEDISDIEGKLACLEVFALGGRGSEDDSAETGYYVVRALLASQLNDVARAMTGRLIIDPASPVVMRLLSTIASRFGVVVSEKAVAAAIPVIGAAGGAVINTLFIDHYQNAARGHFTVRRLERKYGREAVEEAYQSLAI